MSGKMISLTGELHMNSTGFSVTVEALETLKIIGIAYGVYDHAEDLRDCRVTLENGERPALVVQEDVSLHGSPFWKTIRTITEDPEQIQRYMAFRETVERVEKYIAEQNTFFVLDDLETLRKNGRLSRVKSLVASALKIKPVMGSTDEGTICQLDQARGINKALIKMVQHVVEKTENSESKVLAISHCNCKDRAMLLKEALQEKLTTKKIIVLDTAGVSSMYANNGGVIVAV